MRLCAPLALAALACAGADPDKPPTPIVDGDADTDADSDTDTDSDADADTDTGSVDGLWSLSGELRHDAVQPLPAGQITAVLLEVPHIEDLQWIPTDEQAPIGGLAAGGVLPFSLEVPTQPPEALYHAPDPYVPGMEMAVYAVGFFVDEDADGEADETDTYVGSSTTFLIHLRGEVSPDAEAVGGQLGWNQLSETLLFGTVAVPFSGDWDVGSVPTNLLPMPPSDPLTATISADLSIGPAGPRQLDLYSAASSIGSPVAEDTLVSVPLTVGPPPVGATFPDPLPDPPADHLLSDLGDGPVPGASLGLYIAIAHVDLDGSGDYDPLVDLPLASSSNLLPEEQRLLFYIHPTGFDATLYALAFGSVGWVLLQDDGLGYGDLVTADWAAGIPLE